MTKRRSTKRALLLSALALLLCMSMLIGSTFAWFTDSVTSGSNKIQAGTLKIDLELLNADGSWKSIKENNDPIFSYDKWEPGYTDVKVLRVVNEGTLALKWYAKFVSQNELSKLADVIDVYVKAGAQTMPADRSLDGYTKVGTVAEFVNTIETTTVGELKAGEEAYLGIALKMQEEANNDYQGLDLGGAFDIQILATQLTYEKDSFDKDYDENAQFGFVIPDGAAEVTTLDELKNALTAGGDIAIAAPITVNENLTVGTDTALYGNYEELTFTDNSKITVNANTSLEIVGLTLDAGGEFYFDENGTIVYDEDARRTTPLLNVGAGAELRLGTGTVVENVVAKGSAVISATGTADNRASVTLEGATIQNCAGESGTIINVTQAADVVIEAGTVISGNASYNNNNHGIIRVYNAWDAANPSTVTMNGGEINGNFYSGNGMIGLYYGKFIQNGGEINNNSWFEDNQKNNGWYPVIYAHSNSQFVMNGGEITGNRVKNGVINALNSAVVHALLINGGTIKNNAATNHDNQDALAVVISRAADSLKISDTADVSGTVWIYYGTNGNYEGKYYTLEEYFN